jgi:hypothetical protein
MFGLDRLELDGDFLAFVTEMMLYSEVNIT